MQGSPKPASVAERCHSRRGETGDAREWLYLCKGRQSLQALPNAAILDGVRRGDAREGERVKRSVAGGAAIRRKRKRSDLGSSGRRSAQAERAWFLRDDGQRERRRAWFLGTTVSAGGASLVPPGRRSARAHRASCLWGPLRGGAPSCAGLCGGIIWNLLTWQPSRPCTACAGAP